MRLLANDSAIQSGPLQDFLQQSMPPVLARMFARKGSRLKSDRELCLETGWGVQKLRAIYRSPDWSNVTVGDVDAFFKACGLQFNRLRRPRHLLQRAADKGGLEHLRHLRIHPGRKMWEIKQIKHLTRLIETTLSKTVAS